MKNFYDFVDKRKHISTSNYTVLSLDIKSLFTNVLNQEMPDCIDKRLHEFNYSYIEIKEILNLVHLCVSQIAFVFNDMFFIPKLRAWNEKDIFYSAL